MFYQHSNNTIETKGGWVYYFETNNIYYCSSVLDYHPYVPSLEEIQACAEQYTAWTEKFNQTPKSDLTARLDYPKTVTVQTEGEEGEESEQTEEVGSVALDLFKSDLTSYLKTEAAKFEENLNQDMYFMSSLGFKCNGDRRTKSNIQDLITFFDVSAVDGVVSYRDYDNVERQLTKEQLTLLFAEHVANGQALYNQKWEYEQTIENATDLETLRQVHIEFTMADYTASSGESSEGSDSGDDSGDDSGGEEGEKEADTDE